MAIMLQNFEVEARARLTARNSAKPEKETGWHASSFCAPIARLGRYISLLQGPGNVNLGLDQGLATAKQHQRSIEHDLSVAVAENRKQLDQISTGAADGLRQKGQGFLADLRTEADKHVGGLAKNARQISDNIQQLADRFSIDLKKSTEEAIQVFQSRIEQTWQEMMGRTDKRIAETTSTHIVELAKQARQVVERKMSESISHALQQFARSSDEPSSNKSD